MTKRPYHLAGHPTPAQTWRQAVLVTALVVSPLSVTVTHSAEAPRQTADAHVQTQQDPFRKLRALDEGRIASTWSSLPWADGCKNDADSTALAAHVSALAESSSSAQEQRTGPFDLIDPRYRVQLDATAQVGCVVGQLAVQRQVGTQGDFWSADGSAMSWRINEPGSALGDNATLRWQPFDRLAELGLPAPVKKLLGSLTP